MTSLHWQYQANQVTRQQTTIYQHNLHGDTISTNEMVSGFDGSGSAANTFGVGNVPSQFNIGITPDFLRTGGANPVSDRVPNDSQSHIPRRISRAEWERYKEVIIANHPDMTLPALQNFMSTNYGFNASTQQWKKKLREWNLVKNLPPRVPRFVGKRAQSRLQQMGKKTNFTIGGHQIPLDKVNRYMQSYATTSKSKTGSTPDGLTYHTFKSPALQSIQWNTPVHAQDPQHDALPDPVHDASPRNAPDQQDAEMGLNQVQMAFWNGRDLDDVLQECRNAIQLATKEDYMTAKPIFMDCLDGLEVLLSPTHATFLAVLEQYVSFAISNQDFDEATDRVHRSYNKHKERLGSHDKRVWQCLSRLGLLYASRGLTSQAFHMLVNARKGLQSATLRKPEDTYNCVRDTVKAIIDIHKKHGEFDEAETELLNLIEQADKLGEAYQNDSRSHKHDLMHFYHDSLVNREKHSGHAAPNRVQMERLMLEIISFKSMSTEMTQKQMCCWDKLRSFYEITGQREKLENVLLELEHIYSRADFVCLGSEYLTSFKYNMISSFQNLIQYDKAEWWLLRMRDDVETEGFERVSIRMRLANIYFLQGKVDEAVQMLKEAQILGKECLEDDHSFHAFISDSISQKRIIQGCCHDCLVNPSGNKSDKPEILEFITSEAEALDEGGEEREGCCDEEEADDGENADEREEAGDWEGFEDGHDGGDGGLGFSSIVSIFNFED